MNSLEKNTDAPERRLKRTVLSQAPSKGTGFRVIVFSLLIFLASAVYWTNFLNLSTQLPLSGDALFEKGEIWRAFSALVIHSDLGHYLSNMFLLLIFGYFLWGYFGPWVFPVGAIFAGALINVISIMSYDPQIRLLGASGMVYYVVGFWLILYQFIQRRLSFGRRLVNILAVALVLLIPETVKPHVSHRTHFIGFVVGIVFALAYFYFNRVRIRSQEVWEAVPQEVDFIDLEAEYRQSLSDVNTDH